MSGYCIGLYKYMRIDEKTQKKDNLLKIQKEVLGDKSAEIHRKFFTYGEFDRISFEYIESFSRFRDVPKDAIGWIGDRQTHLVYAICKDKEKSEDEIYYMDGRFYEYKENEAVQSNRLFLGLTLLQFKYSQKENYKDMKAFLYECKTKILELVKSEGNLDVKCAVFGTLGSYGLTVIWLADQYIDILQLVTKIRNMGTEDNQKSMFLSAYTIFAQNYCSEDSDWEQRMQNVKGDAILRLTLKKGMDEHIKEKLDSWKPVDGGLFHCVGEHDVFVKIKSSDIFQIFQTDLYFNSDFFKDFVLQTNVQLYEEFEEVCKAPDIQHGNDDKDGVDDSEDNDVLLELRNIQNGYVELREKFAQIFPSTAGMVDTLDMLYSDYISKISTASNEMWIDNFSHQFLRILTCITEFIKNLDSFELKKKVILDIINDLLSDFERQISHIAESNNLVLGTPVCQFRYSGQNNLTLYAYFSIIKKALQFVYEVQEVSVQDEIVPLIVTDIVPIIQSNLFFDYNDNIHKRPKIVTINLPMTALYNPVCYYPYLYHEIFHYIVPRDRRVRNKLLGAVISIRILHSVFREILCQEQSCFVEEKVLDRFIDVYLLRYIYSYVVQNYDNFVGKDIDKDIENLEDAKLNYENVSNLTPTARKYEIQVFKQWLDWINEEENISIKNNFLYEFMSYLYHQPANICNDFMLWEKSCEDTKTAEEIGKLENQFNQFIERLGGIVDNGDLETASKNFASLTEPLTDDVLNEAHTLCDAIKEGMADTAMIALGNVNFPEYLLLFTKTKKDLLIGYKNIEVQDIIRIGMVLEFLCENRRSDDDYMDVVDGAKEAYISMYCGLYCSSHNKDKLLLEAGEWFLQIKECCSRYIARYRIYAALLHKLHEGMLVSGINREHLQRYREENSKYWKQYAQALLECGNYIRNIDINKHKEQWDEKRSLINGRIFDSNLELIYKYQFQDSFTELNRIREKRMEDCKHNLYDKNSFQLKKTGLTTMSSGEKLVKGFDKIQWEHKIKKVGELSTLTADIACLLEKLNQRILGKAEYPIWYRGHMSAEYKLIPSIMRKYKVMKAKCKDKMKVSLGAFLRQEYEEFKFRADGTSEAVERVGYTDSDYIALMQHYSTASNFLDWTEDALSALYFALEGFFDKKVSNKQQNAVLYVFSPALYNYARQKMILRWEANDCRQLEIEKEVVNIAGQNGIPNLTVSYNTDRYNMYQLGKEKNIYENSKPLTSKELEENKWIYYLPLAVYVSRLNKRIQAQSGIFLAYNVYTAPDENDGFDYISLEEIQKRYLKDYKDDQEICPFLYKIEIEDSTREDIANWVKAFGMSKEKCYPELSSIGERIMR